MVNTIWFRFDLLRIFFSRKKFLGVCRPIGSVFGIHHAFWMRFVFSERIRTNMATKERAKWFFSPAVFERSVKVDVNYRSYWCQIMPTENSTISSFYFLEVTEKIHYSFCKICIKIILLMQLLHLWLLILLQYFICVY